MSGDQKVTIVTGASSGFGALSLRAIGRRIGLDDLLVPGSAL